MAELTATQESFIEMMKKSEEHAARGFELLADRSDPEVWFDALEAAGFFDPSKAPGIVEASKPGYYRVPHWPALNYLQAVSKLAGETNKIGLSRKIVAVIRNVSESGKSDGALPGNSNTFRRFAEFLGVLPLDVISLDDLDLLPSWLDNPLDHGMVAHAIAKGILSRLLISDQEDDWEKACRILFHCTAIRQTKLKRFQEDATEPTPVVDSYWLAQLVKNNARDFGTKAGAGAAEILLERLRETFSGSRSKRSWIWRPAIEDHEQNHSFYKTENIFVDGLRDVVLGWIDKDKDTAQPFVQRLLQDDLEIARRIGIHTLSERWSSLKGLYPALITPEFFDSGQLHEVHVLLRTRFFELDRASQDKTLDALRRMRPPKEGLEGKTLLKHCQRIWLTAITDKGL